MNRNVCCAWRRVLGRDRASIIAVDQHFGGAVAAGVRTVGWEALDSGPFCSFHLLAQQDFAIGRLEQNAVCVPLRAVRGFQGGKMA